jgi:undecaprenyl-diphosphatase
MKSPVTKLAEQGVSVLFHQVDQFRRRDADGRGAAAMIPSKNLATLPGVQRFLNSFSSFKKFRQILTQVFVATLCTGVLGLLLKIVIEKIFMRHLPHAEIEHLFSNLPLISFALAAVGSVMIYAGTRKKVNASQELNIKSSCWIGIIQGISLPFRGFSRSGSTISMGLILGISKKKIEAFSFALAVVLTPLVIAKELHRFLHDATITSSSQTFHLLVQCGAGMVLSFLAGLIALKWLSHWLEEGRWKFFGFYCLVAAGGILVLNYFFL